MIYKVRYFGDPVLRKTALKVTKFDDKLKTLSSDMLETMYDYNGVGLAAPQIGISSRLFVALELGPTEDDEEEEAPEGELSREEKKKRWGVVAEHVMVNPIITAREEVQYGQDGCLSVPGLYIEKMRRDAQVTVQYQDVTGAKHERVAEGHFAHVIQHELDHLDGILFFDRLSDEDKRTFMETYRKELAEIQRDAKAVMREIKQERSKQRVK